MKLVLAAFTALSALSCGSLAGAAEQQGLVSTPNQTDSSVTAETRRIYLNASANVLNAARAMPDKYYGAKPSKSLRTFGEVVASVAASEARLCGNINGSDSVDKPKQRTKAALVSWLEQTSSQCRTVFAKLSAENAAQPVKTGAGDISHIAALVRVTAEENEGYGAMKVYFDLNNVTLPASAEAIGAGGKAPLKGPNAS